jgi:hypothetical protein
MDKPASLVLRRVLELGLAAIYLWDMPHMAFSWKHHDQNLSFTEMLNHINSKGYISYVGNENQVEIKGELIPTARAQKIYGLLSDVVHGKITTFETSMPVRFEFVVAEWNQFIELLEEVIGMLVKAFILRFALDADLYQRVPQAKKEFK